ncbi:MAG: ctaG [Hyphomicrobiales bacterium]|jgi:cytochrome c oxidase assembly protein subunit 11|nr:ctaG [Hyphomicrobiales bacterium]
MSTQPPESGSTLQKRHKRVALIVTAAVAGMLGMAYAAVPLYSIFCRATGYGGTPQIVDGPSDTRGKRVMTVRFDSNVSSDLPWTFEPDVPSIQLRTGETATVFFKVHSRSQKPTAGLASYNVAPDQAGLYFNKISCFCFSEQHLAPNETMEMPVVFYLDPKLEQDDVMKLTDSVTLSYTFFAAKTPVASASGKPAL